MLNTLSPPAFGDLKITFQIRSSQDALEATVANIYKWADENDYTSGSLDNSDPEKKATLTLSSTKPKSDQDNDIGGVRGFHRVIAVNYLA